MARTRNIKPSFFTNEVLAECAALARLLFAGLWTHADRDGRLEDRPRRLKVQILPYDDCDVHSLLDELASRGFITRYAARGDNYIQINAFLQHQSPHKDEQSNCFPAPPCDEKTCTVQTPYMHGASTVHAPVKSPLLPSSLTLNPICLPPSACACPETTERSEPSATPKASEPEPASPVIEYPTDGKQKTWWLSLAKLAEYRECYPHLDVEAECRKALQWLRDNPERRKTANGMPRFLGSWLSRANNHNRAGPAHTRQVEAMTDADFGFGSE